MSEITEKIESLVTPLLENEHIELVDITYQKEQGGWTLCLYLDKPSGITLDDCEAWSHRLGDTIDQSGVFQQRYVLEVSSPGLNRPLKKLKDIKKFTGERVSVKLYAPVDGQKNFHGKLMDANEDVLRLYLDEGRDMTLARSQISKCKLDPLL